MLTVADVLDDVKRVLGGCDDEVAYSSINDAVEILSTKAMWDPLRGYVDICAGCDGLVTLPREVGTPLAVTIDGTPTQGHDFWHNFHLNGPGSCFSSSGFHWVDGIPVATFRSPASGGSKLVLELENPSADAGISFRVFGYGVNGNWIRSLEGGVFVDGFLVPAVGGVRTINTSAPLIRRISRISKVPTAGMVRLYRTEDNGETYLRIGQYYPDETEPQYRRIRVSSTCSWVRVAFKKESVTLTRLTDLIPLHSKYAIVTMVKGLKKLDDDRPEEYVKYEKIAVEFLKAKQESVEIPGGPSIQIADGNLIADKSDRLE